ncbi:MAG: hypothetical protein J5I94_02025 [Phaeodactylibacter sp.]|nr:hypothetical protein [Phaeodactylibacter sp.]
MKQFFLLTVLFALFSAASAEAQDCPYSRTAETKGCPHPTTAAKAAAMDASIEKRFDEQAGKTTYVRKEVCSTTGKVSYTAVEYCSRSGKFVNVSPQEKQCLKSKADCVSKRARAAKASGAEGEIHCTTAQKAACAKARAETNSGSGGSGAKAKLVKNQ